MAESFLGEIRAVSFGYAPRGWAFCNGQLLSIAQNMALFSLLGTTYGGNGVNNFALPDLRGRTPVHGGSLHVLGEQGGEASHTLTAAEMPQHTHTANAASQPGDAAAPTGRLWGEQPAATSYTEPPQGGPTTLGAQAVALSGNGAPHDNLPPLLVVNYVIALTGTFPSRN